MTGTWSVCVSGERAWRELTSTVASGSQSRMTSSSRPASAATLADRGGTRTECHRSTESAHALRAPRLSRPAECNSAVIAQVASNNVSGEREAESLTSRGSPRISAVVHAGLAGRHPEVRIREKSQADQVGRTGLRFLSDPHFGPRVARARPRDTADLSARPMYQCYPR